MGAPIIERNFTISLNCYDKKINIDSFIEKLAKKFNSTDCIERFDIDEI